MATLGRTRRDADGDGRGIPRRSAARARRCAMPGPREAGLFHTAILFETQAALAAAVATVAQRHPGTFTGSSDHLVSQAFYFDDPEGNGVELYWDRDRTEWSWTHGQVEMSTLYLDPNAFLQQHLTEAALADHASAPAVIGHVHLSVGDVATAQRFYVDELGFDLTTSFGGQAIFVSAGGYHHHMAMNVWRSRARAAASRPSGSGASTSCCRTPTRSARSASASATSATRCATTGGRCTSTTRGATCCASRSRPRCENGAPCASSGAYRSRVADPLQPRRNS